MEYVQSERELVVIGNALRTSPESAAQDIPALWQRFTQEHGAELPAGARVYSVYCDYESDYRGAYTMVLGREAGAGEVVPNGMRCVTIPRGRFAKAHVQGDASKVWQAWNHVNTEWPGRGERNFGIDYERYTRMPANDGIDVELFVGLR